MKKTRKKSATKKAIKNKVHELKIIPKYYKDLESGLKDFELRKDDRGFKIGDKILLKEFTATNGYTGNEIEKEIGYIFEESAFGLKQGFVILGFKNELGL